MNADPHRGQPVLSAGAPIAQAKGVIVFLHGRGASAEDILSLSGEIGAPGLAYLAPQASGHTWYPFSFLAPIAQNEPWLTSALRKVRETIAAAEQAGIPADRVVLCGFSQGACLATEFMARNPRRYAGLIAFTGGLIGPPNADLTHAGDLAGTPAFFGSGDPDPHVPWLRVQESARILSKMGAAVTMRRYEGRAHAISGEEIDLGRRLVHDTFAAVAQ